MEIKKNTNAVKKLSYLVLSALLVFTPGCKKNYAHINDQHLLFQMDYVNYAWGFQHSGYMIDREGNIYTYNNPEKWNVPDANYMLTEEQYAENLSMCRRSAEKIPPDELSRFSGYIENISMSKITALKNTGADAGTIQYICYKMSDSGKSYKGTLIKMEGDFTCENLNFYSKKVVTWMKGLSNSIQTY